MLAPRGFTSAPCLILLHHYSASAHQLLPYSHHNRNDPLETICVREVLTVAGIADCRRSNRVVFCRHHKNCLKVRSTNIGLPSRVNLEQASCIQLPGTSAIPGLINQRAARSRSSVLRKSLGYLGVQELTVGHGTSSSPSALRIQIAVVHKVVHLRSSSWHRQEPCLSFFSLSFSHFRSFALPLLNSNISAQRRHT